LGKSLLDLSGLALAIDACGHVILGGATDGQGASHGAMDAFVLRVPLEVRR
jgi:hypothetical protein